MLTMTEGQIVGREVGREVGQEVGAAEWDVSYH